MKSLKALLRMLIHGNSNGLPDTRTRVILRWTRIAVLIATGNHPLASIHDPGRFDSPMPPEQLEKRRSREIAALRGMAAG